MNKNQIRITISGPASAMKSPIANKILESLATARPLMTVSVSDHELFEFDEDFMERLDLVEDLHEDADVLIVVINNSPENSLTIHIEPAILGAITVFGAMTDHAYRIANQLVIEMEPSRN